MNEQTYKILQQLAEKFGTTTEYLWGILIKQAYVTAGINILFFSLVLIFGFVLLILHKRFSKERTEIELCKLSDRTFTRKYTIYEEKEWTETVMIICVIIWVTLFLVSFACLIGAVKALANPGYWALKEVLNAL